MRNLVRMSPLLVLLFLGLFAVLSVFETSTRSPILALAATAVAAIVGILNSMQSTHAQSITHFRQAWINDVRDTVARLIALTSNCENRRMLRQTVDCDTNPKGSCEKEEQVNQSLDEMTVLFCRLELLINPKEHEKKMHFPSLRRIVGLEYRPPLSHMELVSLVRRLVDYSKEHVHEKWDSREFERNRQEVVAYTQMVLKREWEVVKKFE